MSAVFTAGFAIWVTFTALTDAGHFATVFTACFYVSRVATVRTEVIEL